VGVCGLTLPLCFHLIKDRKESLGQRVGQLYGLNTIGSVLGAFLGGYYLLNFVNLDHLFKICVFLSVLGVGFAGFVHWRLSAPPRWEMGTAGAITLVTLIGLFMAPLYHRERNIQPFRHPEPIEPTFKGAA